MVLMPVVESVTGMFIVLGKPRHAVRINLAFTWSGVRFEFPSISIAAAPLTIGVAMLVPDKVNRYGE